MVSLFVEFSLILFVGAILSLEELIFGSDKFSACLANCVDETGMWIMLLCCSSFGRNVALPVNTFFNVGWPDVPLLQSIKINLRNNPTA